MMLFRKSFSNMNINVRMSFSAARIYKLTRMTTFIKIILELKMPKSSCLKWTYGRPAIVYRVASLFTRYLTAIGIIP